MFVCSDCMGEFSEDRRSPWPGIDRCGPCMMRRYNRSTLLERREVIKVGGKWSTALVVDGSVVQMLCDHTHETIEEAQACLFNE